MHHLGWVVLGVVGIAAIGGAVYVLTRPAPVTPPAPQTPGPPVTPHYSSHGGDISGQLAGLGQAIPAVVGILGMFV